MKFAICAGALVAGLAFSTGASAQIAGGVNIGTTGIGIELQKPLTETIVGRVNADFLNYEREETLDEIDYDGKLKFSTAGVFADWHPGGASFFLSGGAYFGTREIELSGTPNQAVEIGDTVYAPGSIILKGKIEMSDVQPFLGLGFDNTFSREQGLGFRAMVGASFSDEPDVSLTCTGGSSCATAQADLDEERREIADDAEDFKIFPVVQVGLTYKF